MHLGAHVGTAGGIDTAVERARLLGASALQVFTQSPRQWRHPDPDPEACARFCERRRATGVATVACHATYLINLGATDDTVYHRSLQSLRDTVAAAAMIEADGVVFHLGSHLGRGLDAALHQIVPALEIALGRFPSGSQTALWIENSAGAGGTMGVRLEEIARVIDELGRDPRLGVCLDTCHLWASGVDITDAGRVDDLLDELEGRIGLDRLGCLHVNDSATPLGSNRDRHANVGQGLIGRGLAVMLGHPRLQHLGAIMETPGAAGHGADAAEMAAIRRLHRNGLRRWARRADRV
jgi:deoxyribonuclease IV